MLLKLFKEMPLFLPWILFCVVSLLITAYLKLKSADYESVMFQEDSSNLSVLLLHRVAYHVIEFGSNLSMHWIASSFYCILLRDILLEYFCLKLSSFCRIGFGTVQCTIIRRTNSLCEFLDSLVIKILPQLLLFTVVFVRIFQSVNFKVGIKAAIFLASSVSTIIGLHYLRSLLRYHVNKAYEESNFKRIEILESYEKIISYCCLEDELMEYYDSLQGYTRLRYVYTASYHAIGLISEVLLMVTSVILMNGLIGDESFVSVVLLTEKLKDIIYSILQEIETVLIDYSNYNYSNYEPSDVDSDDDKISVSAFKNSIDVSNLTVEVGTKRILDNISFRIKKGEKVAIAGLTGSGKSVLMDCIFGIVDYQGSIKIDDVEVRDIQRRSLTEHMSYITQNIKIFNDSIRSNLLVGDDEISDDEMIQVCDKYGCHDLFKKLGYTKIVGDRGKMVSGGQRQRIILLRGIMRNKDILVIDGAFTGLDQKTEEMFVKTFSESTSEKTVICSTQNTSMFPYFDEVIFLSAGRILKGPYNSLIKDSPEFREFCKVKKISRIDFGRIAKSILSPVR